MQSKWQNIIKVIYPLIIFLVLATLVACNPPPLVQQLLPLLSQQLLPLHHQVL